MLFSCFHMKVTNQQISQSGGCMQWRVYVKIIVYLEISGSDLIPKADCLDRFFVHLSPSKQMLTMGHASQTLFSSLTHHSTIQCYITYVIVKGPLINKESVRQGKHFCDINITHWNNSVLDLLMARGFIVVVFTLSVFALFFYI